MYDSISITQGADYEYAGSSETNYYAVITKLTDNVWAGGGSGTIEYDAYHIITTFYYWYSDDAYRRSGDSGHIADSASVEGSGTRFSRSGNIVTHENMTTNEGTDSVTYFCYNENHRSTYDHVTFSATNSKGEGTPSTEYGSKTYGTSVWHNSDWAANISASAYTSSSSPCPAGGGTSTLTVSGSHKTQEERPYTRTAYEYLEGTYTSGSPYKDLQRTYTDSGSDWESKQSVTDYPIPSVSGTGFSLSGTTVSIASEGTTPYSSGRNGTASVTNGEASASVTLYQQYNRKESATSISAEVSLTAEPTLIPASGGTVRITAYITRTLQGQWTSTAPYTDYDNAGDIELKQGSVGIDIVGHGEYRDLTVPSTHITTQQTFTVTGTYTGDRQYSGQVIYKQEAYVVPTIITDVDYLIIPSSGSASFKLTTNGNWTIGYDYAMCALDGTDMGHDQAALLVSQHSGGAETEKVITVSRGSFTQGSVVCVTISMADNVSKNVVIMPQLSFSAIQSWNPTTSSSTIRAVTTDYPNIVWSGTTSWLHANGENISVDANSGTQRTSTLTVYGATLFEYFGTRVDLHSDTETISVTQASVEYTISVNPTYVALGLGETCQFGITTNAPSWSWSDSRSTMRQQAKTASTITLLLAATGYASGQDTIVTFTTPSGSTATATVHMK